MTVMSQAAKQTQTILTGMLVTMAGIAAIRGTIKLLHDFNLTMATTGGVAGATAKQFDELQGAALLLGATTKFTSNEAAQGQLFLARAGFEVREILTAMPGVLDLAQAGLLDVGRAADVASNLLRAFGLEASEMTRIADVLVATANSSNTTVEQLAQAMKFAAPLARALGEEIEDLAALIGVLGDAGVQDTMAGTGSRQLYAAFIQPTEKMKVALADLGLGLDDVNPKFNSMNDIVQKLVDRGAGVEEFAKMVPRRALTSLLIYAHNIDKVIEKSEELREAEGASFEMRMRMQDTLAGSWALLKSAVQAVILKHQSFTKSLKDSLTFWGDAVRLAAGFKIEGAEVTDRLKAAAFALKALTAGVKIFVGAKVLGALLKGFQLLKVALMSNILTAIPQILLTAASAIYVFRGHLLGLGKPLEEFGFWLQGFFKWWQTDLWPKMAKFAVGAMDWAGDAITKVWNNLFHDSKNANSGMADVSWEAARAVVAAFKWMSAITISLWDWAHSNIANGMNAMVLGWSTLRQGFSKFLDVLKETGSMQTALMSGFGRTKNVFLEDLSAIDWEDPTDKIAELVTEGAGAVLETTLGVADLKEEWQELNLVISDSTGKIRDYAEEFAKTARMKEAMEQWTIMLHVIQKITGLDLTPTITKVKALTAELEAKANTLARNEELLDAWEASLRSATKEQHRATIMSSDFNTVQKVIMLATLDGIKLDERRLKMFVNMTNALEKMKAAEEARAAAADFGTRIEKELSKLTLKRALLQDISYETRVLAMAEAEGVKLSPDLVTENAERLRSIDIQRKEIEAIEDKLDLYSSLSKEVSGAFETMIFDGGRFTDVLRDMVKEMGRLIFKMMVMKQIENFLGGNPNAADNSGGVLGAIFGLAKGGVIDGGRVTPFAGGGIVDRPTITPMANGRALMGEAGPEAILPLQRTSDGKLGVQTTGGGSGGRGNTYVTMNISTKDADSFRRSKAQVTRDMNRAINRSGDRNARTQKPGF